MADKTTENTTEETSEQSPKKSSKKLLFIGLLVGLLIGAGAGFGAYTMLSAPSPVTAEEKTALPEKQNEKPEIDPHFVRLERVSIPISAADRVLATLMVDFSMEIDGSSNKLKVVQSLPEIRDALLRHFSVTPIGKENAPRSVDYIRLKDTVKDISNEILHQPLVLRVMIVQAQQF